MSITLCIIGANCMSIPACIIGANCMSIKVCRNGANCRPYAYTSVSKAASSQCILQVQDMTAGWSVCLSVKYYRNRVDSLFVFFFLFTLLRVL